MWSFTLNLLGIEIDTENKNILNYFMHLLSCMFVYTCQFVCEFECVGVLQPEFLIS